MTETVSVCVSGSYRVSITAIDGHVRYIRNIKEGELFGVPSALSGAPFPTDVTCVQAGETLEIGRQRFEELLRAEPDIAMAVIKGLASRVSEMFGLLEADMLPSLRARVYQRLVLLGKFVLTRDRDGNIPLNLTQGEIAQTVNASRQKVHAELKRMQAEGLVKLGYRRVILVQKDMAAGRLGG